MSRWNVSNTGDKVADSLNNFWALEPEILCLVLISELFKGVSFMKGLWGFLESFSDHIHTHILTYTHSYNILTCSPYSSDRKIGVRSSVLEY